MWIILHRMVGRRRRPGIEPDPNRRIWTKEELAPGLTQAEIEKIREVVNHDYAEAKAKQRESIESRLKKWPFHDIKEMFLGLFFVGCMLISGIVFFGLLPGLSNVLFFILFWVCWFIPVIVVGIVLDRISTKKENEACREFFKKFPRYTKILKKKERGGIKK